MRPTTADQPSVASRARADTDLVIVTGAVRRRSQHRRAGAGERRLLRGGQPAAGADAGHGRAGVRRPAAPPGAPRWCSTCAVAAFSTDLTGAVAALRDRGFSPRVVFVDADDEVLIRRFENVRRSHPLQGNGRLVRRHRGRARAARRGARHGRRADRHQPPQRQPAAQPRRGAVRRRGRAPAAGDRAVVRLQVRSAAGRRLRAGRALPAQPVLGAELRDLTGQDERGQPLRARISGARRRSWRPTPG